MITNTQTTKPQFTLRAIFGYTAALCVPLAMIAAGKPFGLIALPLVVGNCIGYIVLRVDGFRTEVATAAVATLVMLVAYFMAYIVYESMEEMRHNMDKNSCPPAIEELVLPPSADPKPQGDRSL